MKKFLSAVLALAVMVSAFTACSGGGDESRSDEEKVLVIGGSGPLTGDYATYGTSAKQGAEIAEEEINEAGGVNGWTVKVLYEDDQTDPQQAVNAYSTLMDNGMDVSLGGVTSGACIAVSEEANKDGILMLTPSGSQLECTQYDNGFRVCFQDPDQGTYSAQFIKDNALGEKVAVLYDKSNDYSVGIYEAFKEKAREVDLEIVDTQAFTDQSNTDFTVQLQSIKASGADLLFLPLYAQECAYILTQSDSIGLDVVFFGVDGMDGVMEKIGEENLGLTEGVMLLTPFAASSEDEKVVSFVTKYKEKYNAVPDQFAADAYDAVYTIVEAFKASGAVPGDRDFNEKMVAAMTEITVDGLTGTMTWTADGEPHKTAMAVVIRDGRYEAYSADAPSEAENPEAE